MENKKVRHLLGISGGKDSAALAIYLHQKHPELDVEYYWCDTGKELDETYKLVSILESYLGKKITPLRAASGSHHEEPFDHFIEQYGGYIPSSNARWCTKKLKLEPFEEFVGEDPVISYVGIRDDEDREGYISKKSNIQSIFPFRRNIWSLDVINKVFGHLQRERLVELYRAEVANGLPERAIEIARRPLTANYSQQYKLEDLLEIGISAFNRVVFALLKDMDYPLSRAKDFALLDNEDRLVREDIFRILRESGVGVPEYYEEVEFTVNGKKGSYARSRSGCFFCFFQQKIEWVWLLEQHPELYEKAMDYEKDGYQWMQEETLAELSRPERVKAIKEDHLARQGRAKEKGSAYLVDLLAGAEGEGCAACFI